MEIKRNHIFINKGDTIYTDVSIKYKSGKLFTPSEEAKAEFVVYKENQKLISSPIDETQKIICQTDALSIGTYNWMVRVESNGIRETPLKGVLQVKGD